jgi:serine/threonine-protein kinase HipA
MKALAVEDGAQVLGRYPADKYAVTAEVAVTALAELCPARVVALRALFGQLCFAWLTGNGDVHGKNLSVLATPEGEWRISPAYDLPSTLPYGDHTLALSMQGRVTGLSRRSLMGFASAIGLPERSARRVLDSILDATADLEERIANAEPPFPPQAMSALLRRTHARSLMALKNLQRNCISFSAIDDHVERLPGRSGSVLVPGTSWRTGQPKRSTARILLTESSAATL